MCLTQCGFMLGRLVPSLPEPYVCFASVHVCVSVPTCYLDLSVSGIPSPERSLWFYYRSMFAVKLLHRLA